MSSTTDVISELVRAANEVETLGDLECRRLLDQAVMTIRDQRRTIGVPSSPTVAGALTDLQNMAEALKTGHRTNEQIATALLNAAGMIRDLHIVLDTATDIKIGGGNSR
jgi:hypothetical protein